LLVGCPSSLWTGIISNDIAIAALLHRHGALSFWDYAAAGPYLAIRMNPAGPEGHLTHKDAVFISPHKFIGGPGTPGVLVVKRSVCSNTIPSVPGGGTVAWVSPSTVRYMDHAVHREEAGTPAILESIRAGLVFQLKEAVGAEAIQEREHGFVSRSIASFQQNERLRVLGNPALERLSIVSLLARHGKGYLHWNFVVTLLNDLFGIQARGGCSCAGPYGYRLLGMTPELSRAFDSMVEAGYEGIRPGWFRINFNYFITETAFQYLLGAIHMIAREGWKLLPQYHFDPRSGMWTHVEGHPEPPLRLKDLSYVGGECEFRSMRANEPESALEGYLDKARQIFAAARATPQRKPSDSPSVPEKFEELRWFPTPREAWEELRRAS
jgi:selenocysteine lyase/cysteine desulfurase